MEEGATEQTGYRFLVRGIVALGLGVATLLVFLFGPWPVAVVLLAVAVCVAPRALLDGAAHSHDSAGPV